MSSYPCLLLNALTPKEINQVTINWSFSWWGDHVRPAYVACETTEILFLRPASILQDRRNGWVGYRRRTGGSHEDFTTSVATLIWIR